MFCVCALFKFIFISTLTLLGSETRVVSVAWWAKPLNRPQCLLGWRAEDSRRPGFKSRSRRELSARLDQPACYDVKFWDRYTGLCPLENLIRYYTRVKRFVMDIPAVEITDGPPPCARDHRPVVRSCSHLATAGGGWCLDPPTSIPIVRASVLVEVGREGSSQSFCPSLRQARTAACQAVSLLSLSFDRNDYRHRLQWHCPIDRPRRGCTTCSSGSQLSFWYCRALLPDVHLQGPLLCCWRRVVLVPVVSIWSDADFFISGDDRSGPFTVYCSVPHGSVLGLIKFISYTEDVVELFDRHGLSRHLFADDKQLYTDALPMQWASSLSPPSLVLRP